MAETWIGLAAVADVVQGTFVVGSAMDGKVKVTFSGTQVRRGGCCCVMMVAAW